MIDVAAIADRLQKLEREQSELREALVRAEAERDEYRKLYRLLQEENEQLKRGLLGQKAERLPKDDAQLSLAILELALGGQTPSFDEPAIEIEQTIPEHKRRKPVRKPLPEHLPRVEIEILPDEVKRKGLDQFERIGEETREVLERRPSSMVVVKVVRPKFVPRKEASPAGADGPRASTQRPSEVAPKLGPTLGAVEQPQRDALPQQVPRERASSEGPASDAATIILIAPPPELPIERGLAGPGLLADTIVRRWQDHEPLHRRETIHARDGVDLARSTICGWHFELAQLALPVVDAMQQECLGQPYLCTDATGVLVQQKEKCRTGHFWVLVAPELHVLFRFTPRHDSAAVDELLAGYRGYLVADAHAVYDHLYANGEVTEVSCWAHSRRYYYKSLASDPERARVALSIIGALFKIERTIAGAPPGKRKSVRAKHSAPLVDKFFAWCDAEADRVLDDTPIARAIGYARNQRTSLRRFLDDWRLPLHNNRSYAAHGITSVMPRSRLCRAPGCESTPHRSFRAKV